MATGKLLYILFIIMHVIMIILSSFIRSICQEEVWILPRRNFRNSHPLYRVRGLRSLSAGKALHHRLGGLLLFVAVKFKFLFFVIVFFSLL